MPRYPQPEREQHVSTTAPAREVQATNTAIHPCRLACVYVPSLPLQLLVRRHPEWIDRPVAVVDKDKPHGTVLWVNERA